MGWGPVIPAQIDFADPRAPRAPAFGDLYHPRAGAMAQAQAVFLAGTGLPARWAGAARFVVLETGFGLGHNFLATWCAWRRDPRACTTLYFVSVDKHPPRRADLARAHAQDSADADRLQRRLADALLAAWPPTTPDLHALDFDAGRVRLLLAFGDAAQVLPELLLRADAVFLDGFAPRVNPEMWSDRLLAQLPRLCAPGARLATWSVASALRQALSAAGFEVHKAPGFGGKRDITLAHFAPRFAPPEPAGRLAQPTAREVAVVGAGLAGAAAARALARQGLAVTVFDRLPAPAMATSGNAGGLFHSVLHADDGAHARWLRAAALATERLLRPLVAAGALPGAVDGLLRGERRLSVAQMQALLDAQAQPPEHVAVHWPGLNGAEAAWRFSGGGWVAPAALVSHWLRQAQAQLRLGCEVAALQRLPGDDDAAPRWRLCDARGATLAEADAVLLCGAEDTPRLLGAPAWPPLRRVRGQTSVLPASVTAQQDALNAALALPLADAGYALRLADGRVLCGAAARPGDDDRSLRDDDHLHNLAVLRRLTGWDGAVDLAALAGRVGHRLGTADKLPLVGPVPVALPATIADDEARARRAWTQPRAVPRRAGLHVLTALGSRGITQAALAGEVLAARLTGAPCPLPASLVDALDPARFSVRAARRAGGGVGSVE